MSLVLDLITPLNPPTLDGRGNAQHWMIRTADAALDRTLPHYQAMFTTQEAWDELLVTPAVLGFQGYMNPHVSTRHDTNVAFVERRFQRNLSRSWGKALAAWGRTFRDEGQPFYQVMLDNSTLYAEQVALYLGLAGLGVQNYVGPLSLHLMALCQNQRILDHLGIDTEIGFLSFPAPPIIPFSLRQLFAHGLMALLSREVYLLVALGGMDPPNDQLDTVLGSYLNFDYAGPPASYIHVERGPGYWQLHTHIEGAPSAIPPVADGFHTGIPGFDRPTDERLLIHDLFFYGTPQTFPLGLLTLELEFLFSPEFIAGLYIKRSDSPTGLRERVLLVHIPVLLDVLPVGVTWELWLSVEGAPPVPPPIAFAGRLWVNDIQGNESNHAFWSVSGRALQVQPFSRTLALVPLLGINTIVVPDLFAYVAFGDATLLKGHLTVNLVIDNGNTVQVFLKRSDSLLFDTLISSTTGIVYDLPLLPPGVKWQLGVLVVHTASILAPFYLSGYFWVEDASGAISNHAQYRIFGVQIF